MLTLLGLNVLLAMGRIGQLNLLDSMSSALGLVNAIVVLIILRSELTTLVSFNTVAAIVLGLSLVWVIARLLARQKERQACRPDSLLLKKMLKYGAKFYVSILAGVVIFRADLLIVNHFRGGSEAGVYAIAAQVSFLLMMLPGVIAALLFPRVASFQDPQRRVRDPGYATCFVRDGDHVHRSAAGSFAAAVIYGARFADATIQLLILLPGIYLVQH